MQVQKPRMSMSLACPEDNEKWKRSIEKNKGDKN